MTKRCTSNTGANPGLKAAAAAAIKIFFGLILFAGFCETSSSRDEKTSYTKVEEKVWQYAKAVGCQIHFEPKNIIEHDVDHDGQREYIALIFIDPGCKGGNTQGVSAFLVLRSDYRSNVYVLPQFSGFNTPSVDFPRIIDGISVKDNLISYRARDYDWSKDAVCCPSLVIEGTASLEKIRVSLPDGRAIETWYWKSIRK